TVRQRAASQRRSGADLRSLRAEVEETERVVHELEARLAELRTKLADPSLYTSEAGVIESRRLDAERIEVEKQLEHAFARWAEALAEAEAANAAARWLRCGRRRTEAAVRHASVVWQVRAGRNDERRPGQSLFSTRAGSTRVARRAGTRHAKTATAPSSNGADM